MKRLILTSVLLCLLLGQGCPVPTEPDDQPLTEPVLVEDSLQNDWPGPLVSDGSGEPAETGTCCLRDGCFLGVAREACQSAGGAYLGPGRDCAGCASLDGEIIAALRNQDSDNDGRSDLDELLEGTDPEDPSDGPDIDGDGRPNGQDLDVDGDQIFNAYDRDIDGDGILNELDNDMDGDGEANLEDDDADGDAVKDDDDEDDDDDQSDDDDDADGDDDEDADKKSEIDEAKDDEDFDLLALARRLFDDDADQVDDDDFDLLALARRLFDDAEEEPEEFDLLALANRFCDEAIDETAEREQRARDEDEAYAFLRKMFDEDGDGLFDAVDPDPDGDGSRDDDGDGVSDLDELRNGSNPEDADSDGDGINDAEDPSP